MMRADIQRDNRTGEQFSPLRGPEDREGLINWLEAGYQQGLYARQPYEPIALRSLMMWAGNQWSSVIADPIYEWSRKDLYPEGCEVARKVNNQIPQFVRSIIATMMENMPRIECIPATSEQMDVEAAGTATKWLRYSHRKDEERRLRQGELMQLFGCGEVIRRTWYDPDVSENKWSGDVETESCHFFRYVKDPWSVGVWPPRFLVEYDARDVDWIREKYGKSVKPESVAAAADFEDRLAMNVFYNANAARESMKNAAVVKRMYVAPCGRWPNGHVWVWANKVLLDEHDLQGGWWPFARAAWLDVPMRLYPMSLVELLTADQRELNVLLSVMWESVIRQVRGDVITAGPNQTGARERILNQQTGAKQIMLPDGVTRFEFLNYSVDWRHAELSYNRLLTAMHEKAGANKPTMGQPLERVRRVGELQLLREGDITGLTWHMSNFSHDFLAPISQQKLRLARKYIRGDRYFTIFGDRSGTIYWRGSDFRDTTDVIPVPVPYLTPAMKREARLHALQLELLPPYETKLKELTSRLMLRDMGLEEVEDEIAGVLGDLEDLKKTCQFLGQRYEDTEIMLAGLRQRLLATQMMQSTQQIQAEQAAAAPALGEGEAEPAAMAAG